MKYLLTVLFLILPGPANAQIPVGDYPRIVLYFAAEGTAVNKPSGTSQLLAASEVTCQLENTAAPVGSPPSSYFVNWPDPLNIGQFCQVNATVYVQQLVPGMWHAGLTFVMPSGKWDPCPEQAVNGFCYLKTMDGRLYPTYNIPGHETPSFAVGVFLRAPTNLILKADHL